MVNAELQWTLGVAESVQEFLLYGGESQLLFFGNPHIQPQDLDYTITLLARLGREQGNSGYPVQLRSLALGLLVDLLD